MVAGVIPKREAVSRSKTSSGAQTLYLLVGGHVGQLRQFLQLGHHFGRIGIQLVGVGIFQGVLELVRLTRSSTVRSCTGCMNRVMPATSSSLRLQAANHVAGADFALGQRFEIDQDAAAVQGGIGSVDADERGETSTAGSVRITLVSFCWRVDISGNDTVCAASETP
jgi:hypothetical protein